LAYARLPDVAGRLSMEEDVEYKFRGGFAENYIQLRHSIKRPDENRNPSLRNDKVNVAQLKDKCTIETTQNGYTPRANIYTLELSTKRIVAANIRKMRR
jgi:hypothetical protein